MSVCSDDTRSTCSTSSVSNAPMRCPYCNWNKTSRLLFNHIHNNHPNEVYSALGTAKLIERNIDEECLLELHFTWEGYQEDDEFKEFPEQRQLVIFGCLGCNQTYQTRARAKVHWKKSEKCHKDHLKYVNKYLEKIKKSDAKSKQGNGWIDELSDKQLFDAVDRLARWYYRLLHLDIPYLTSLDLNKGCTLDEKYMKYDIKPASEFRTRIEKIKAYKEYTKKLRTLEINFEKYITLPYNYKLPNPWAINSTAEEDGLAPVGTNYEAVGQAAVQKQQEQQKALEQPLLLKKQLLLQQTLEAQPEPTLTHETISKPLSRSTTPLRSLEPIAEEPPKK